MYFSHCRKVPKGQQPDIPFLFHQLQPKLRKLATLKQCSFDIVSASELTKLHIWLRKEFYPTCTYNIIYVIKKDSNYLRAFIYYIPFLVFISAIFALTSKPICISKSRISWNISFIISFGFGLLILVPINSSLRF